MHPCDKNTGCPDHKCTLVELGWADWVILYIMIGLQVLLVLVFKLFICPLCRKEREASDQATPRRSDLAAGLFGVG